MSYCYDKSIDNRLAAIEGHVKGVRQMVKDEKDCEDIILQLNAIEGSVSKLAKLIIKDHLNHCVRESIENGESDILERFTTVLEKYL